MAKNYEWSAALTVESGGYDNELIAIYEGSTLLFEGAVSNPPKTIDTGWHQTDATTGTGTYTYVYRDSDTGQNDYSMKVEVTVQDTWTVSIDHRNYMTVTVNTVITSVQRTWGGGAVNADRHLWARRDASGPAFFNFVDNGSTAHDILIAAGLNPPEINLGSYTFTLAPGEMATRSTVYWRNTTYGYEGLQIPNIYTDILGIGVHFRNILPRDYRPGATLNTNSSIWKSHNRVNGACHILSNVSNMTWKELRTLDGDSGGKGNPPLILTAANANSWRNQKKLGKE